MKKEHECIIIGGGAAGMMAAITLAGYGIETCILEHTSRIGTKILQTVMENVILQTLTWVKQCTRIKTRSGSWM